MTNKDKLIELAERVEKAIDIGPIESLCREVEQFDRRPNVNGSCAGYLLDLYDAKRLLPENHLYSICYDRNEVRAVVALDLAERENGFSAIPKNTRRAETRALVAACLRALASMEDQS